MERRYMRYATTTRSMCQHCLSTSICVKRWSSRERRQRAESKHAYRTFELPAQRLRCILTTPKPTLGYSWQGDNRGTPYVLQNEIGHVVANEQEGHKYYLVCAKLSLWGELLDMMVGSKP